MSIGAVVIGRNEGERLEACLDSLLATVAQMVYVDSGSTDGSVATARRRGAHVAELDLSIPFTAGRARNEGVSVLRRLAPDLRYVQFVDGDSELVPGWMTRAAAFLDGHGDIAMVCGRLREKHPNRTIYNLLCDMEWEGKPGETRACGGLAMVRLAAFDRVSGFKPDLIAGEEPELCVRLRQNGWRVWRLDEEMGYHDAAMTRFSQWWRRTLRGGYAYAQGAHLHGSSPERYCVKESMSIWFWGLALPMSILVAAAAITPWVLLLVFLYPLQIARLAFVLGSRSAKTWWRAAFLVMGKFPEMLGQVKFLRDRFRQERATLIEYK